MGFKFIHMADVHLDTPFYSSENSVRGLLKNAIKDAFAAAVELAVQQQVNAVLISGDLFDSSTFSFATEKFLIEKLQYLADHHILVFYSPGNHDALQDGWRTRSICWPSNTIVFDSDMPVTHQVKDKNGKVLAQVTGVAHVRQSEPENLVSRFPVNKTKTIPHVGIVHALVTGYKHSAMHERYAPCSISDMLLKDYDYWALGHVHTRAEIYQHPFIIYPGNISGRNPVETGRKGIYIVDIDDQKRIDINFYPVSPVIWETVTVDGLLHIDTLDKLEVHIKRHIDKQTNIYEDTEHLLLRINLKGPCALYKDLKYEENIQSLCDCVKFATGADYVEILVDRLTPPIHPEQFVGQPHLLGTTFELIEHIKKDQNLLLELKPEQLAGYQYAGNCNVLEYLNKLLDGIDFEIISRMILEDQL